MASLRDDGRGFFSLCQRLPQMVRETHRLQSHAEIPRGMRPFFNKVSARDRQSGGRNRKGAALAQSARSIPTTLPQLNYCAARRPVVASRHPAESRDKLEPVQVRRSAHQGSPSQRRHGTLARVPQRPADAARFNFEASPTSIRRLLPPRIWTRDQLEGSRPARVAGTTARAVA